LLKKGKIYPALSKKQPKEGKKVEKYPLDKLCEMALSECFDSQYVSVVDLVLCLLKRPDSLLWQAIQRSQKNPDYFKDLILKYRPKSDTIDGKTVSFTKRLESLISDWKAQEKTGEKEVTIALLEDVNTLTYACCLLDVRADMIIGNIDQSIIEGPVRFNTPALNKGTNLTLKARRGELMPCIGREREIRNIATILLRMTKNMPVLIGEAGVGKTAVAEGFAHYLLTNEAPTRLKGSTVIEFPVSMFAAGHKYVGETEQFTLRVIEELKRNPDIILFLDEIHTLIGAGRAENQTNDVAQILKPALARGEIRIIGATTLDEYMILEKDTAFERRMNPVRIEEPSVENAIKMLMGVKDRFEKHHLLKITNDAVESAVKLSRDYLTLRKLPDKAFDLIASACARAEGFGSVKEVTRREIIEMLTDMTGIEIADVDRPLEAKTADLEEKIRSEVIGQDNAVRKIIGRLKLAYGGIIRRDKPLAVFLFLGFPGSGKTHLAKMLARHLFGDSRRFIRFDMGEFSESHSVSRLIGSPPGYEGHQEGGKLTEYVKNNPFSVVLFDEIEKCHYQVADVFLSLFGEGHITDGRGRSIDARNTICIMTSNCGIEEITNSRHLFLGEVDPEEMENRLREGLSREFRPELLNRLDDVIVFQKLDSDHLIDIARIHLSRIIRRMSELGICLSIDDNVIDILAEQASEMGEGARHLERLIEERILLPLSEKRLSKELEGVTKIRITLKESELNFHTGD